MKKIKYAWFLRKARDIQELKEEERKYKELNPYVITKEVKLSHAEFVHFILHFMEDCSWISEEDGGREMVNGKSCTCVIRVRDESTGETVLVNSEGYRYARYVALEKEI